MGSRRRRERDLRAAGRDGADGPEAGPPHRRWSAAALVLLLTASALSLLSWANVDPTAGRFFDERHTLRNLRALIVDGRLDPPSTLYPSLSYLPYAPVLAASHALHRATGIVELEVFDPDGRPPVTKSGYLLARSVSVMAGLASLLLTYVAGRRTISSQAGLLAAALLALTWGFLQVSIKVKPDVLVMLFTLAAFLWSLNALEKPSAGRFALAGVGVGLAAAAKYYGVTAAIPLAAGTLSAGLWRPAAWGRLALAATASAATFLALNPWPRRILENVALQRREYASRGAELGVSHWEMPLREASWLFDNHGAPVLALAALGCVGLAARATGWRGGRPDRLGALALLAMILGHLAFFAAATTYFTFQNFVPVSPFVCLAAAWAGIGLSEGLIRRIPDRRRGIARALVWSPVAVWVLWVLGSRAYDATIPTTPEMAQRELARLETRWMRVVHQEPLGDQMTLVSQVGGPVILSVQEATSAPPGLLEGGAAVVFRAGRLEGPSAASYARFLRSWPGPVVRVEPRWLRVRGPALVLALNDWRAVGEPLRLPFEARRGRRRIPLPEPLRQGEVVSLGVSFRSPRMHLLPRLLAVGDSAELELYALRSRGRRPWTVTRRFRLRRSAAALVVELPELPESVVPQRVEVYRWQDGPGRSNG